jgi:C-terminal processing protease CtpA/Prc
MGVEFLATQTLIDGLEYYITTIEDTNEIEMYRREIDIYKKNMGQFVNTEDSDNTVQEVIATQKSPEYVVILTDKEVGSAAENFVMAAKQSKKVKVIGTPTYGVLDYGAARKFDFGCSEYELYLPGYRSLRLPEYPIDNIGVQPDIYLDKSVTDYVKFAKEYLEN